MDTGASERFSDGGEDSSKSSDHGCVDRFGAVVGRIVEEGVTADDGHVAASVAVHHAGLPARDDPARNPAIDGDSGSCDLVGYHAFHFVIGSLDCVAGLLGDRKSVV